MRAIENELAEPAVRAWRTSCAVDGGPTGEQQRIIDALARGYFGIEADPASLDPLRPGDIAGVFGDRAEKHRLLETMIVLEFARHPASAAQADRVDAYAKALDVDDDMQRVARDYVAGAHVELAADYGRFADHVVPEPRLADVPDAELAERLRALGALPAGTLGRAFFDFYDRYQLAFPGEPGGGTVTLVAHDMSHVLGGYEPTPVDEIALQAMLTSACDGEAHFSSLVASLSLFEIGMLPFDEITPKVGALARPGAVDTFAEAVRRGVACSADFATMDHWAVIDSPLDDLRHDLCIPPRAV